MLKIFISAILSLFLFSNLYAAQSTIIESEGYACMGEDKSMKEKLLELYEECIKEAKAKQREGLPQ